jgi:hypothetical protein
VIVSIAIATPSTYVEVLERLVCSEGDLPAAAARAFLKFKFDPEDTERMHELALKAQQGNLTPQEQVELNNYEFLGTFLGILQSKARRSLKERKARA